MKFGTFHFPTHYGIDIAELAKALEDRGFESLFVCEHTHIPVSRRTPFPGGGDLPDRYYHTYDPFVGLSFAAAATDTLRLGTGICLLPQHDPIVTAKATATLDLLSGGRFEFALGAGWNAEEMENHGVEYDTRFKVMEDKIKAIKVLWTEEHAQYHGPFVDFDPVISSPKPAQSPHPPVLFGGETDHTLKRVVQLGDGWFPRAGPKFEPGEGMARLKRIAEENDRKPSDFTVSVFRAPPDAATLESYREAGIDRVLFDVPDEGRDAVLELLDKYAKLIE
ncbi:MAG: LLM class F420-dependent oxidoreductase [Rhizobiales bacterium NRL2]|jgi:probable F420-dependent oxidoreductase|nr:MAG: LLM class F420-dependent oxidoreductase [Rhizobiales bacterium NRL2]